MTVAEKYILARTVYKSSNNFLKKGWGGGSLHCMNEIVTVLNFIYLLLLYVANCNVLSICAV